MDRDRSKVNEHFWQIGVLASHYLKRDTDHSALIIGSAGGQETKASLIYGATYVDTAELVPTVVDLATGSYSPYIGDIFHNPAVHPHAARVAASCARRIVSTTSFRSTATTRARASRREAAPCRPCICRPKKPTKSTSRT